MEVIKANSIDPLEIIIPLIDPDTVDFVTADILASADINAYYWDSSGTPSYVKATFSGTVELVIPANGTVYLHRISMNQSMFSDIDTSKPIALAVVDATVPKAFKDTGFEIKLQQKIVVNIDAPTVIERKASGDKAVRITVECLDVDGNKIVPQDVSLRAFNETVNGNFTDFYDDFAMGVAASVGGYGGSSRRLKLDSGETGVYYTYAKIEDDEALGQYRWEIVIKPYDTNQPWQIASKSTEIVAFGLSGTVELTDSNANKIVVAKAVKNYDASGIGQGTDSIHEDIMDNIDVNETKIDVIDGIVDTILTNTVNIEGKIDTIDTEVGVINGKVDVIDGNVDSLLTGQGVIISKVDDVQTGVDAIVAKLPPGTISDLDLGTVIDGITLEESIELVQAMVAGRILKDTPETGDLTFYKRDNATILVITRTTESERTRL